MKAIDRFYEYLAEKSLKPTAIEKEIGLSNGYLSAQKKRGADMGEGMMLKVIDYFRDINPLWLLTGEGPMLRDSKNPEESKLGVTPIATPISPAEESIIYKMYKDEKEEKERLVKEKESKIDHLQSELLSAKEELAAFKAKYPEFPTDKPVGLGSSETAPHAPSHPHSPTSEHYYGGSLPPQQENQ